jgi:hypothetical protein
MRMRVFYKENYGSAATTKVLHVSLLKVICVDPEFLEPPLDLARWEKYKVEMFMRKQYLEKKRTPEDIAEECGVSVEALNPYIAKLQNGEKFDEFTDEYLLRIDALGYQEMNFSFHSDFIDTSYRYTEDYGHEISEDLKKVASENEGIMLQTIWDITIFDCNFEAGKSAEELAGSVPWNIDSYTSGIGQDLLTKIFSAKFSSSFFTKCAILADVLTNHSSDQSLAEFIENNDIGLPLAQRINLAEEIGDLDEDDQDNLDYIEETWEQLCEILGVDKDGDYTTLSDMKLN